MECLCAQTRPRFISTLIQKSFGGMESEPMLIPREKTPLLEKSSEEDRIYDAASLRTVCPMQYQWNYSHPQRRNVTTSVVGLKNCHIHKNLTQNGEPQKYSWGMRRRRRKKSYSSPLPSHSIERILQVPVTCG